MERRPRPLVRLMEPVCSSRMVSRRLLKDAVAVFLYHEVSDQPSEFNRRFELNLRPAVFAKQLDLIREAFHLIDPQQLLNGDYRTPAALITFDDGNASYFRTALPIMKERRVPSVAFLNMGPIRGDVCWSGLVTYLQHCEPGFYDARHPRPSGNDYCRFTQEEVGGYLRSSDAQGLLERVRAFRGPIATEADLAVANDEPLAYFGNHLYNHYNAAQLSDRLPEAYWDNQRLLDRLSRGMRLWSYPFSCSSDATTQWLFGEGTQAIFTGAGAGRRASGGSAVKLILKVTAVRASEEPKPLVFDWLTGINTNDEAPGGRIMLSPLVTRATLPKLSR